MNTKKVVMAVAVPINGCPICGHKQFIVSEIKHNLYLTNRDGEIIDSRELMSNIEGHCGSCNNTFKMASTPYGFIPTNDLREFINAYDRELDINEKYMIENPMMKGSEKNEK